MLSMDLALLKRQIRMFHLFDELFSGEVGYLPHSYLE